MPIHQTQLAMAKPQMFGLFVAAGRQRRHFACPHVGAEAGRCLGVDYVAAGRLRQGTGRLAVAVELVDARSTRIVWTETCAAPAANLLEAANRSRTLSPCDPLLFGMLGSRAIVHLRRGQFGEAADWAWQAAGRPNAHVNILGLAALCLARRLPDAPHRQLHRRHTRGTHGRHRHKDRHQPR